MSVPKNHSEPKDYLQEIADAKLVAPGVEGEDLYSSLLSPEVKGAGIPSITTGTSTDKTEEPHKEAPPPDPSAVLSPVPHQPTPPSAADRERKLAVFILWGLDEASKHLLQSSDLLFLS